MDLAGDAQPDRYWKDFCEVVGKPELIADPRFDEVKIRAGTRRVDCDIRRGVREAPAP